MDDANRIEQRLADVREACRRSGVRLTHQRLEIFRQVLASEDHPDAETVHRRMRGRMPTLSLDTVYRSLWLLHELGAVTTLGPARGGTRFEPNLNHHNHFVCRVCGVTRDFTQPGPEEIALPESLSEFGRVESASIEVQGVCRECRTRSARSVREEERSE